MFILPLMQMLGLPNGTNLKAVVGQAATTRWLNVARAKAKKPSGKGGLGKWFGEQWVDVKTGKACGRKSAKGKSKRPYPACRPKKVASKITKSEAKKKTGPKRVKWSTTASGKKRS
jgi:hypothetical protein